VRGEVGGGRFGDGFLGGGVGSLLGPIIERAPGGAIGRTIAAAVVGGTASKLGGGKFSNGATTAAFVHLFNEQLHPREHNKRLEAVRFQLGRARAEHNRINSDPSENPFGIDEGYRRAPVGGFVYETSLPLTEDPIYQVGLQVNVLIPTGRGDSHGGDNVPFWHRRVAVAVAEGVDDYYKVDYAFMATESHTDYYVQSPEGQVRYFDHRTGSCTDIDGGDAC